MAESKIGRVEYAVVELGGVRYAIVRERLFREMAQEACVELGVPRSGAASPDAAFSSMDMEKGTVARRLALRRKRAGLTQAELARRAGIRPETLNRVERGRTAPDFSTIGKLVSTLEKAEEALGMR